MSWSWVDTEYSIHWCTASTLECSSSLHSHESELTPECSVSFQRASLHYRPPSASSPWELTGKVTLSYSQGWELTNGWIECQHRARRPSTASKYSSNLAQLRPPSSHHHGLQVHLQTRSITSSKCLFQLAWLRPPNSLDHCVHVYLQTCMITASKFAWSRLQVHVQIHSITSSECISEFTHLSFPGAPQIALKHCLHPVQIYRV